eukprot:SAG22_NODE_9597_length_580_cov_1.380457_2_plen_41_part_01
MGVRDSVLNFLHPIFQPGLRFSTRVGRKEYIIGVGTGIFEF